MSVYRRPFSFAAFIISEVITLGIGITASFFTRPEIPGWYVTLNKPSFNPPNWLFAPVWTALYIIIGIAAYMVWQRRDGSEHFKTTRNLYIAQLVLNFSWSLVFFALHQVAGALVVIGLLLASIIGCIITFGRYSTLASWLMVPYLLWVGFATLLNFNIYLLNN